jgi:hypothetical protein
MEVSHYAGDQPCWESCPDRFHDEPASRVREDEAARAHWLIERLEKIARNRGLPREDSDELLEAASTLQAYEKALRAADELARTIETSLPVPPPAITAALNYRLTRATLKGEDDD